MSPAFQASQTCAPEKPSLPGRPSNAATSASAAPPRGWKPASTSIRSRCRQWKRRQVVVVAERGVLVAGFPVARRAHAMQQAAVVHHRQVEATAVPGHQVRRDSARCRRRNARAARARCSPRHPDSTPCSESPRRRAQAMATTRCCGSGRNSLPLFSRRSANIALATSASASPPGPATGARSPHPEWSRCRRPGSSSARGQHQRLHLAHRCGHAGEQGAADDGKADVQFDDLRDGRHRLHIVVVEPMAGVHGEPELGRLPRRAAQALQFARPLGPVAIRVGARCAVRSPARPSRARPASAPRPDR